MRITSAEITKSKDMVRIFIDNHYAFSIPHEEYLRHNLYEESDITEEQLENIKQKVLIHSARQKAVVYLTIKDRTEKELIQKLEEAGFDTDTARGATEELKTIGYLNDRRYAQKYLSERLRTKALSKKALKFELEHKGISGDIISEVLSEFETDDEEVALRAARKKFGKYNLAEPAVEKKVISFLMHRGFTLEVAKRTIKQILADS